MSSSQQLIEMPPLAILLRLFVPFYGRLSLALITVLLGASSAVAQEPAKLRIAELRMGFSGAYKLGCWTQVEVVIDGGEEPFTGLVEITARDSEGVTNSVVTPPDRAVAIVPGQRTSTRMFVRPGQDGAAIQVRVIDERGKVRARRNFYPGPEPGGEVIRYGLPATNRIVAAFGTRRGLSELTSGEEAQSDLMAMRAVTVESAADLPIEWFGYEGIDTLVLSTGQPELYRPLAAGRQRIDALARWVELGGRLVLFCGADAPELIGPDGPLAPLAPGVYDTMAPLRESQPIEAFANAEQTISPGRQFQMEVPKLTDVEGEILAFAGQDPTDLPLVVRARRGLGEITLIAVDLDSALLSEWQGRGNFLRQALQWPSDNEAGASGQQEDLLDRVRRALDGSFVGVRTAPFALVALLVVLYILLIGPGDYFFVKRVLKRMELTWLTFPLIVFIVSAAAYWAAHYMKGDQLRVNQVEIVDVDLGSGLARGTVWTHFFSPRVDRYNLTLAPRFGDEEISIPSEAATSSPGESAPPRRLVGWLGGTGYGLDGMQGRRTNTDLFDRGYMFTPRLDAIVELPVQEWSTKTLIGRWSAELIEPIDAQLEELDDDLIAGQITNRTGVELEECLLMHGQWAYELPNLTDGAVATIDETMQATTVETALANIDSGYQVGGRPVDVASQRLDPNSTDVDRLTTAILFHEALGGSGYSGTPSRYQAFLDMSRQLRGDQAVLFARVAQPTGSQWTNGETSLASDQDRRWVYYRFVIPLQESGQ